MSDIIQALWIGSPLSKLEQLCLKSFVECGHDVHLYTYGDVQNVPDGVVVKDANDIIKQSEVFTYYKGSYAGFADWFRWEMLYKVGGYWVDTDVVCLKKFDFKEEYVFGEEHGGKVCPAVLKFPKGDPFCKWIVDVCNSPNTFFPYDNWKRKLRKIFRIICYLNDRNKIMWGETGGPMGVTLALEHFNMMGQAKPFTYFFPITSENWKEIFTSELKDDITLFKNTYAIHLWNEMTRQSKTFDKNGDFAPDSLFEQLKKKYLIQ